MFGGACAGLAGALSVAGLHAAMGREHDRRARLDRAGAGRVRVLAAVAGAGRRLSVRRGHASAAACMRRRLGIGIPSQLLSSLPYLATDHRSRSDLAQQAADDDRTRRPRSGRPFVPDR